MQRRARLHRRLPRSGETFHRQFAYPFSERWQHVYRDGGVSSRSSSPQRRGDPSPGSEVPHQPGPSIFATAAAGDTGCLARSEKTGTHAGARVCRFVRTVMRRRSWFRTWGNGMTFVKILLVALLTLPGYAQVAVHYEPTL